MEFMDAIKTRYSCRKFDGRPVEPAQLAAILEAGRLAPTAKNLQEQRIYVAQGEDALSKIDAVTPCRYNAGTVLVVAWDRDKVFTYPGGARDSGAEDATIVATHMLLAASDQGVNSCWVNFFDPDKAREVLGLPENEEILMFLALGYADPASVKAPGPVNRKPLEETVRYL